MAKLYRDLGKRTFGACDKQTDAIKAAIEAEVEALFMHEEHGFEDLVLKNTTPAALTRFATLKHPVATASGREVRRPKSQSRRPCPTCSLGQRAGGALQTFWLNVLKMRFAVPEEKLVPR